MVLRIPLLLVDNFHIGLFRLGEKGRLLNFTTPFVFAVPRDAAKCQAASWLYLHIFIKMRALTTCLNVRFEKVDFTYEKEEFYQFLNASAGLALAPLSFQSHKLIRFPSNELTIVWTFKVGLLTGLLAYWLTPSPLALLDILGFLIKPRCLQQPSVLLDVGGSGRWRHPVLGW